MVIGLVCWDRGLGYFGRAIIGRRCDSCTDGVWNLCCVHIASVYHIVDGHLRETIETQWIFPDSPRSKGIDGVWIVDIIHVHFLQDGLGALIDTIPVTITILIEQVHILEPLLRPPLVEDSHLMQFLPNDFLPHVILPILIVKTAILVEVAVILVTWLTTHRVVDGLQDDAWFQLDILCLKFP